jgi:hypothetical protein
LCKEGQVSRVTRIRGLALGCAAAASFALSPAAAAPEAPQPGARGEIVVTGVRTSPRQIERFVAALTPAPVRGQVPRFEETVCPEAMGLTPQHNKAVAARIRSVAAAAGLDLGKAGCKSNVFVVVAQDRNAVVKQIRRKWADPLGDRPQDPKASDPAAVLHLEGLLDADGIPAGVKGNEDGRGGYYVVVSTSGTSRIRPLSRPHFLAAAMVVEPAALTGLTTMQLADYAVMRLLARTDPARLETSAAPSILRALEAPIGGEVPVSLTHWDFGFLKALYASGERRYVSQQRAEMQRLLRKDLRTRPSRGE